MSSIAPDSTILFMPEGNILAHVGRSLSIARALTRRGLNVSFAASGKHAFRLREPGRTVLPIYTPPREELLGRLRRGGSAFTEDELRRCAEAEIRLLRELEPAVVVGDFRPSLCISAPVAGVPYVCVTNTVWTRYCAFELDPPESWLPTRILGKGLLRRLRPVLEGPVFRHYARPFNRLRRSYGLPELNDVRDCMCSEEVTLLADTPDLFPTTDLPGGFVEIGPVLWEPDVPDPPWLEALTPSGPTVYVTMGSTGPLRAMKGLTRRLLDVGLQVICTTTEDRPLWPDEPRFHSAPYARGSRLCRAADVVVCHGGNGTIYQALAQGTPVVGIPEFHDQEFNMQRIEALKLGLRATSGSRMEAEVEDAVRTVIGDGEYETRARAFERKISGRDAPGEAAKWILGAARGEVGSTAGREQEWSAVASSSSAGC